MRTREDKADEKEILKKTESEDQKEDSRQESENTNKISVGTIKGHNCPQKECDGSDDW